MAEFDDMLGSLLSNPEAMGQIMQMAQSLMGGQSSGEGGAAGGQPTAAVPPAPAAQAAASPAAPPAWGPAGGSPLTGGAFPAGGGAPAAPGVPPAAGPGSPGAFASPAGPEASLLSALGGVDIKTLTGLLPILRELGGSRDTNARQLLFALRPYLKPERQDKVERALQLARLFRVGKKFLLKGDGHV